MSTILNYTCPKCHQKVAKEVDQESGIIDIICTNPECGYKFQGRVKKKAADSPVKEEEKKPLDNSSKDVLPLGKSIKVNETKDVVCPHCNQQTRIEAAETAGMKIVKCQICKGPIEIEFLKPTFGVDKVKFPYRGKLQISKSIFFKKDIPLRVGVNVIGRTDKQTPSDIQLDDQYVSRRSVEIEVEVGEKGGFFFRFRVVKSTNPVLVNSHRIEPGSEILLNYGDIITLGRTKLRFDKIV